MKAKLICLDFDGVIHSYATGWQGADQIPDPPVPGALDFLRRLVADDRFSVAIYSSRSGSMGARGAMRAWLRSHGLESEVLAAISFPTSKPPAWVTIDDRAFTFTGQWPELETLASFRPWYAFG